jgi:hypothetical protein
VTLLVALGALWAPLLFLAPALILLAGVLALRAASTAATARFPSSGLTRRELLERRALTGLLHILQPLVRLAGRLRHGLTPWRSFTRESGAFPVPRMFERWSENWVDPVEWVRCFEIGITRAGAVVRRGGEFDSWDIETRGGVLAGARLTAAVEEHGNGKQLVRIRCRPRLSATALMMTVLLLALAASAALDGAAIAAIVLAAAGCAVALRTLSEASAAFGLTARVLREQTPRGLAVLESAGDSGDRSPVDESTPGRPIARS